MFSRGVFYAMSVGAVQTVFEIYLDTPKISTQRVCSTPSFTQSDMENTGPTAAHNSTDLAGWTLQI